MLTEVIEVRFKGNRKEFFTWPSDEPLALHDPVIVEVERGQDFGRVSAVGPVAARKCGGGCSGCSLAAAAASPPSPSSSPSPERRIVRRATPDDATRADRLHGEEDAVRRRVMERVTTLALAMKVSDAEWQWDKKKLTVYFTAEQRVDFRVLVRDLASLFHTRIELRQIGARDEAKRLDGVGRCGRRRQGAAHRRRAGAGPVGGHLSGNGGAAQRGRRHARRGAREAQDRS